MKTPCVICGKDVEVDDDYKPELCCHAFDCGCQGLPINPVFCDECMSEFEEDGRRWVEDKWEAAGNG